LDLTGKKWGPETKPVFQSDTLLAAILYLRKSLSPSHYHSAHTSKQQKGKKKNVLCR